jgi:hypothetical protein
MKREIETILIFFILSFFIITSAEATIDFEAWVTAPAMFTVGKAEKVNIYVKNVADEDSYQISYTKQARRQNNDVPHLISISLQSNRIRRLKTNETGDTFAMVTVLAPIDIGNVTFNISSETQPNSFHSTSIEVNRTGMPIILREFDSFCLVQLMMFVILVLIVSYASYFS